MLDKVSEHRKIPATELVATLHADGRILAEEIHADRDYPAVPRSARDGFAVHAADLPGTLEVIGEVRAGETFPRPVERGQAVEIMTGAPMPEGADAVVMVEHTSRENGRVIVGRTHRSGDNFNEKGVGARGGELVMTRGSRLTFSEIALLATVGRDRVAVYKKPRVAILATGDEIVEVNARPEPFQIRNSNTWSMAIQSARAGGEPVILPVARDNYEDTRALVEQGLGCDLLLLSGGASAGKYDLVEQVLADLGAKFYFTRALIQPGQPIVFGRTQGKFFFGLPGNPASTMVTLEIFARAAIELLGGAAEARLPFLQTRLAQDFRQKSGLTRFLPAAVSADGSSVAPLSWQGSGDVVTIAKSNAFLVTDPDREVWSEGDLIQVLLK